MSTAMPTALHMDKVLASATAAVATILACAAAWACSAVSLGAAPSVVRTDEFSGAPTHSPRPIERVLTPVRGPKLHRVSCAGGGGGAQSCYAMTLARTPAASSRGN
jgi:hypothetical protein